jgi:hypothetical protein
MVVILSLIPGPGRYFSGLGRFDVEAGGSLAGKLSSEASSTLSQWRGGSRIALRPAGLTGDATPGEMAAGDLLVRFFMSAMSRLLQALHPFEPGRRLVV